MSRDINLHTLFGTSFELPAEGKSQEAVSQEGKGATDPSGKNQFQSDVTARTPCLSPRIDLWNTSTRLFVPRTESQVIDDEAQERAVTDAWDHGTPAEREALRGPHLAVQVSQKLEQKDVDGVLALIRDEKATHPETPGLDQLTSIGADIDRRFRTQTVLQLVNGALLHHYARLSSEDRSQFAEVLRTSFQPQVERFQADVSSGRMSLSAAYRQLASTTVTVRTQKWLGETVRSANLQEILREAGPTVNSDLEEIVAGHGTIREMEASVVGLARHYKGLGSAEAATYLATSAKEGIYATQEAAEVLQGIETVAADVQRRDFLLGLLPMNWLSADALKNVGGTVASLLVPARIAGRASMMAVSLARPLIAKWIQSTLVRGGLEFVLGAAVSTVAMPLASHPEGVSLSNYLKEVRRSAPIALLGPLGSVVQNPVMHRLAATTMMMGYEYMTNPEVRNADPWLFAAHTAVTNEIAMAAHAPEVGSGYDHVRMNIANERLQEAGVSARRFGREFGRGLLYGPLGLMGMSIGGFGGGGGSRRYAGRDGSGRTRPVIPELDSRPSGARPLGVSHATGNPVYEMPVMRVTPPTVGAAALGHRRPGERQVSVMPAIDGPIAPPAGYEQTRVDAQPYGASAEAQRETPPVRETTPAAAPVVVALPFRVGAGRLQDVVLKWDLQTRRAGEESPTLPVNAQFKSMTGGSREISITVPAESQATQVAAQVKAEAARFGFTAGESGTSSPFSFELTMPGEQQRVAVRIRIGNIQQAPRFEPIGDRQFGYNGFMGTSEFPSESSVRGELNKLPGIEGQQVRELLNDTPGNRQHVARVRAEVAAQVASETASHGRGPTMDRLLRLVASNLHIDYDHVRSALSPELKTTFDRMLAQALPDNVPVHQIPAERLGTTSWGFGADPTPGEFTVQSTLGDLRSQGLVSFIPGDQPSFVLIEARN